MKKQKKIPVFPSGNEKELTLQKKPILPMTIGSGVGVFFKKEVLLSTPERSVLGYGIAKGHCLALRDKNGLPFDTQAEVIYIM